MQRLIFTTLAAIALCGCSADRYTVEGDIEGLDGTIYMLDEDEMVVDSAKVDNGHFRFSGKAAQPGIRILSDSRDSEPSFAAMLIVEPGRIVVSDDPEQPFRKRVEGTPSNDASNAYSDKAYALLLEFRSPETGEERREAIAEEYDRLTRTTVEANRDNYFGALLLMQQLAYDLSGQELLEEIAAFSPAIQQTDALVALKQSAEQKLRTDVGQPYIDVEAPDASGQTVSLKSVVENPANKYVLLDFWASWCGPCMGEVPYLKQTYAAFHAKGFEIYGVSLDKSRDAWLEAVEKNGMNWIQVGSLDAFQDEAAEKYAVQSIPSNFLIDGATGEIIACNLRGEALYEKIAGLLGK